MKIVLPWPDKRLTPNSKRRSHWRTYQPVAKKARTDAHYLTIEAMQRHGEDWLAGKGTIPLAITFFPPDRRHRDDDGIIGSFKHARDGIADGLGVDDRQFRPSYHVGEPEKPGRVEVVIGPCQE